MSRMSNELLAIIQTEAEAAMIFVGVPSKVSIDVARSLCERIMMRAGGENYYIPKRDHLIIRKRALKDLAEGHGIREVCAVHGITSRTLRTWRKEQTRVAASSKRDTK